MIHPSGIETSDYEIYAPTKAQVFSAALRAKDHYVRPRYKPNPLVVLLLIGIPVIVFLVWVVG